MLAIRIYINNNERCKKFYIIQGILCFFIFMTKQTIGVYFFIAFAISELFIERRKIRNLLISVIPIIVGVAIYITYLYFNNSLIKFIDYTFLGMIDFKQNFSIESWIILLALVNVNVVGTEWVTKKANKNLKKLFIFSTIMLLISYPILCDFHSRMALIYTIICFAYYLDGIKMEFNTGKLETIILVVLLCYNIFVCILNFNNWINNHINDCDDPYYGAIYSQGVDLRINYVVEYIKKSEKQVIILSPEATLYNVKLNINNGILDLPLKGNTGLNGQEKIINKIKKLNNVKIMLTKYMYYQEYPEVQDFVRKNYKKTDELIGVFEIYE